MKRAKILLLLVIYSLQFAVTVDTALAKQEGPSPALASILHENLQAANEDSSKSNHVNIIDIFPEQSWASLQPEVTNTVTQIPAPPVAPLELLQLPPPLPFTVVSDWLEDSQHIVVLAGMGETYLLCNSCELPNAIKVGGKLAQEYELKSLDNRQLTLFSQQGGEQSLAL
ncbi:hypothetical protein [Aeromonas jandaei]|uniref:hypothetical protein n=1 Tax=Aeromonas jandaei TaxID=650 RepID=UPI001ABF4D35|nr:hypothetical protein [Aeromonas jandaei]QSR71965.1 hypothetical protein GP488_05750 [Aeromonas jandaei]